MGKKILEATVYCQDLFLKKDNFKKYYSKKNKQYRKIVNYILPSKNIGNSLDIFNLCNFLMKPESKFINGEIITLDGGSHTTKIDPFNLLFNFKKL